MFQNFFPQGVAVDPENVRRPGLVALCLFQDHFKQGLFYCVYDEAVKLAFAVAVHPGYILLDAFIKPAFQKRFDILFDLSHGKWDAEIPAVGQGSMA